MVADLQTNDRIIEAQVATVATRFEGAVSTLAAKMDGIVNTLTAQLTSISKDLAVTAREVKDIAEEVRLAQKTFVNLQVYDVRHVELERRVDTCIADNKVQDNRLLKIERQQWFFAGGISILMVIIEIAGHVLDKGWR